MSPFLLLNFHKCCRFSSTSAGRGLFHSQEKTKLREIFQRLAVKTKRDGNEMFINRSGDDFEDSAAARRVSISASL